MRLTIMTLCVFGILAAGMAQKKGSTENSAIPSVGLPVGAQAPPFALRDQYGLTQSNETLKGVSGTILLFFRSADW